MLELVGSPYDPTDLLTATPAMVAHAHRYVAHRGETAQRSAGDLQPAARGNRPAGLAREPTALADRGWSATFPSHPMRGLLVGYESIGRRHLTNLHQLGVTDWAVVHTGRGTLPLEPPCAIRIYPNLSKALREEQPAFAVIANPTSLHIPTAVACASAGCHLLVEKPISHASTDTDTLQRAAVLSGSSVLVGFQFRFDTALIRIREHLASGSLGVPLHASVTWAEHLPSWHPWEDWRSSYAARPELGGGVHHTICHPIDYLRWLFGDPSVLSASLVHSGPLGLPVPEAADVTMQFPGGVTVQLHLDYWGRPPAHWMHIVCTRGTIEWDYMGGLLRIWDAAGDGWRTDDVPGVEGRNELFLAEARHFLNVLEGREVPKCTIADGIATVRICEAIDRAADSKSQVNMLAGSWVVPPGKRAGVNTASSHVDGGSAR